MARAPSPASERRGITHCLLPITYFQSLLSRYTFLALIMALKSANELRLQVGQLLIMGFDGVEVSSRLRTTLSTLQPGGIILFRRNIEAADQTYALNRECHSYLRTPPFLSVDLEGGTVDRFRDLIAPMPSVADVVAAGQKKLLRKHGLLLGAECRTLGFNTDFTPCLDLRLPPSLNVMTSRTISPSSKETVAGAREILRGLHDCYILSCGKHFPGLGEGRLDSHKGMPEIMKPLKRLWEEDLYPYRELKRQLPFVMVCHASYPAVTGDRTPASISRKWITDILRKKIGYKGLIVTDDLEMGGIQEALPVEQAAVEAIRAGCNLFIVSRQEELVWRTYENVVRNAEKDKRFADLVRNAAKRVTSFKKRAGEFKKRPKPPSAKSIDSLRRKIWEFTEEIRLDSDAARTA